MVHFSQTFPHECISRAGLYASTCAKYAVPESTSNRHTFSSMSSLHLTLAEARCRPLCMQDYTPHFCIHVFTQCRDGLLMATRAFEVVASRSWQHQHRIYFYLSIIVQAKSLDGRQQGLDCPAHNGAGKRSVLGMFVQTRRHVRTTWTNARSSLPSALNFFIVYPPDSLLIFHVGFSKMRRDHLLLRGVEANQYVIPLSCLTLVSAQPPCASIPSAQTCDPT
ncbi:hypothetical protein FPV67DRAFT_906700 [Lyophyllum atratum]|nr:hypothetical protein FPV67DRAFT_906700 [Lyophyllum atratum]